MTEFSPERLNTAPVDLSEKESGLMDELRDALEVLDSLRTAFNDPSNSTNVTDPVANRQVVVRDISSLTDILTDLADYCQKRDQDFAAALEILNKSEDMARVGLHMGGVIHELNNLIGSMMGYAQLAKMTGMDEDVNKAVDIAFDTTQRARDLLVQLRSISRRKNTLDVMNVQETLESVMHLLEPLLDEKGVKLAKQFGPVPWLIGSAKDIRQSLLIVCAAIVHHLPEGAILKMSCSQSGEYVQIVLESDPQGGASSSQLSLEPIVNDSKHSPSDRSLLSKDNQKRVNDCLEKCNGKLDVQAGPNDSFTFSFSLPLTI